MKNNQNKSLLYYIFAAYGITWVCWITALVTWGLAWLLLKIYGGKTLNA